MGKQWLEGKVGVRLLVRVAVRVWVELFVVLRNEGEGECGGLWRCRQGWG